MKEYLVFHGGMDATSKDPGLVSFRAIGTKVYVRGPKKQAQRWANIIKKSIVLSESIKDGNLTFESFINANKYSSWTWFTEKDFDNYSDVYNNVKGSTIVIDIKPNKNEK